MDSSPDVLADTVRAKRIAIDNDLELLRVRVTQVRPRQLAAQWGSKAWPVAAGAAAFWFWRRRRRSVNSLNGLLVRTLADLRATEREQVPVLDRMRRMASNRDLASLFTMHQEETKGQVGRIERALRSLGEKPPRGHSSAIKALDNEARALLKREGNANVRDASLIAIAQRAEHLEIAGYGTARTFAQTLGYTYAAQLLEKSLEEERAMDAQLTRVAERFVNFESIR